MIVMGCKPCVTHMLDFPLFGHEIEYECRQFGQQDSSRTQAYDISNKSESVEEDELTIGGLLGGKLSLFRVGSSFSYF